MPVHSLLIKRVQFCHLGRSASGDDSITNDLDRGRVKAGEKEIGPFASKGTRHSAADGASGPVDHRHFVVQHHSVVPVLIRWVAYQGRWVAYQGWRHHETARMGGAFFSAQFAGRPVSI